MIGRNWAISVGILALAGAGAGIAMADRAVMIRVDDGNDALLDRIYQGTTLEQFVMSVLEPVRQADRDGDGLDRADIDRVKLRRATQVRGNAIGQLLASDLNGDLKVTRAELTEASEGSLDDRERRAVGMLGRYDTNNDGVITITEAAAGAIDQRPDTALDALLALDPNGDGWLTIAEARTAATEAFNRIDTDRDGRISAQEYQVIEGRRRDRQFARRCNLPPLPAGAQLTAFGSYEGDSISSAYIGNADTVTEAIDVTIEPGSTPLYLVLASYESVVWRVSGATNRVVRVVASSGTPADYALAPPATDQPRFQKTGRRVEVAPDPILRTSAAGVIGIPRDRVTIATGDCPGYFSDMKDHEAKATRATLRATFGREPDGMFASYSARRVSLPSGTIEQSEQKAAPLPTGFDAATWPDATRYWPGGLTPVKAEAIVARTRVAPYQVLPAQMGLSQLIGSGQIVRNGGVYRIVKPIAHIPPGMGGAHLATFELAKGVPLPVGDPVHSCIRDEGAKPLTPNAPTCRYPTPD